MKRTYPLLTLIALVAFLLALAGCGGSSSSGSGGGQPGKVALFATDSLGNNDHVWVKIFKITADSNSGSQTIFDDAVGKVVDLASLHDSAGSKFAFLSQSGITGGPFKSSTVTMAKDLTLVPHLATNGVPKQFADQFDDGSGNSKVTFGFKKPRTLGQGDPILVVDFDLAQWNEVAGKIVPDIKESDGNGIDDQGRHNEDGQHGTISALTGTAPDQVFTLTTGNGKSVIVHTDVNTVIFRSNSQNNPALANGQKVEAEGKFDATGGFFLAKAIKIEDANGDHGQGAHGTPGNLNAGAGTFDITVKGCDGFIPKGTVIHVATDGNTVFRGSHGVSLTKDEFFAALATATSVQVEGSYDSGTSTITAVRAKIDGEDHGGGGGGDGGHGNAEAKGAASNLDSAAGTFSMTLTEWDGFAGSAGAVVSITTTGDTVFVGANHNVVSKADFFADLATASSVEVVGDFANGVIAVRKCRIDN